MHVPYRRTLRPFSQAKHPVRHRPSVRLLFCACVSVCWSRWWLRATWLSRRDRRATAAKKPASSTSGTVRRENTILARVVKHPCTTVVCTITITGNHNNYTHQPEPITLHKKLYIPVFLLSIFGSDFYSVSPRDGVVVLCDHHAPTCSMENELQPRSIRNMNIPRLKQEETQ